MLHQLATRDDETCRLIEGQYLGEDGRSELAHAVAGKERRFDAEFKQRGAERVRHGEQSRLGVPGVMNGRAVGEHQAEQPARGGEGGVDRGGRACQVGPIRRAGSVKVTGHAGVLGTLTGAQQPDPRRTAAMTRWFVDAGCRGGIAVQGAGEVGAGAGRREAVFERALTRLLV